MAASILAEEDGRFTNKASTSSAVAIPSEEEDDNEEEEMILVIIFMVNVDIAYIAYDG